MFAGDYAERVAGDWCWRGGSGGRARIAAGGFVRGGLDFYFLVEPEFVGSGRGKRAEDCAGAGGGHFEIGESVWGVCAGVSRGAVGRFSVALSSAGRLIGWEKRQWLVTSG